jgi:hypothetical protein
MRFGGPSEPKSGSEVSVPPLDLRHHPLNEWSIVWKFQPMDQPSDQHPVILFNPPAPGNLEAQLDALARVLAAIARRIATQPAHSVQSAPAKKAA